MTAHTAYRWAVEVTLEGGTAFLWGTPTPETKATRADARAYLNRLRATVALMKRADARVVPVVVETRVAA